MPTMSKEYLKKYIKEKHEEDYHCNICNGHYKKYFKKVHESSKKHKKALEQNEEKKNQNENTLAFKLMKENMLLKQELKDSNELLHLVKLIIQ